MSQFNKYFWNDTSSPTLNGITGSLITVLRACLVDGYGSKPAAGWTMEYSQSTGQISTAVFRQGGGNQFYIRVRDNGSPAANFGLIRGYETMTNYHVNSGSNPFPLDPQSAQTDDSILVLKSSDANSTARRWSVYADDRTFYVFTQGQTSAADQHYYHGAMFGDIYSLSGSGDSYRTAIIGRYDGTTGPIGTFNINDYFTLYNAQINPPSGSYIARDYLGLNNSIAFILAGGQGYSATGIYSSDGLVPAANPTDGGLYVYKIWAVEPLSSGYYSIRGWLRGLYQIMHPYSALGLAENGFTGSGDLSGKTFNIIPVIGSTGTTIMRGGVLIETSDTLDTN